MSGTSASVGSEGYRPMQQELLLNEDLRKTEQQVVQRSLTRASHSSCIPTIRKVIGICQPIFLIAICMIAAALAGKATENNDSEGKALAFSIVGIGAVALILSLWSCCHGSNDQR